jgi:small subunit ribosomal protein S1
MVEIGSTIEAVVTGVKHYGVYLDHEGQEVVVLLPEVSWKPVRDLASAVRVGDTLKVLVLRYNYKTQQIVGSVRRLYPAENPYRDLSRLPPGEILHGKVRFVAGDAATVDLANGAWGHLPKRFLTRALHAGDDVEVEIDSLEVDEGRLTFVPARETDPTTNGVVGAAPATTPSGTA